MPFLKKGTGSPPIFSIYVKILKYFILTKTPSQIEMATLEDTVGKTALVATGDGRIIVG